MRYIGGKNKIKKDLHLIFNEKAKGKPFVDLFCGSCKVAMGITEASEVYAVDNNPHLIRLFSEVVQGWLPPDTITKEMYLYHKEHKPNTPLTGFLGHGCSFGGKWFDTYIDYDKRTNRPYHQEAKNSLVKDKPKLEKIKFVCSDYDKFDIPEGSVVYCDPPYKNVTKYYYDKSFDRGQFFKWAKENKNKYDIYISEYKENVPEGFSIVWERNIKRNLHGGNPTPAMTTEVLCIP